MKITSLVRLALFVAFHFAFCFSDLQAADPFAEGVRSTEPLTPEQEQKSFHLPPGLTIQLVAAEPDLRKPMNVAFDGAGRLWITESREYPFPAKSDAEAPLLRFLHFSLAPGFSVVREENRAAALTAVAEVPPRQPDWKNR